VTPNLEKGKRLALGIGPEALTAVLAIVASTAIAGDAFGKGFPLDDAWIHMVYGSALLHTGALQYNDGHAATGCTSPVWAMVVALAHLIALAKGPSLRAVACVQSFGIAAHAAESVLAARLVRAWTTQPRWAPALALGAGALVSCAPTLAFASASGMEVPLAGALLLAAMLAVSRGRWTAAGAVAGIAAVTRPEAVLALLAVALLAVAMEPPRVALRALGAGLVPILARIARDLIVSGHPLPATFYIKARPGVQPVGRALSRGFVEVLGGMRPASHVAFWVCVAVALAVGAVAFARRDHGAPGLRPLRLIGATAALGLAYSAGISALTPMQLPHAFYYQRYLAPPLTMMIVAAFAAVPSLAQFALQGRLRLWLAASCVLAALAVGDEVSAWRFERHRFADEVSSINALQVTIGRWVNESLAPGAVVWTVDAGAIRYWGRHPTVDLIRLNTPELFVGLKVKKAWWPSAVALIPGLFQLVTPEPLLESALVVDAPSDSSQWRDASRHEVYRCRPDADHARDNRVVVFFQQDILLGVGRCVSDRKGTD
jgi:hypothetical protein